MYPWNWYNLGYDLGNLVYDLETARPSFLLIMEPQKFCCKKKKKKFCCVKVTLVRGMYLILCLSVQSTGSDLMFLLYIYS